MDNWEYMGWVPCVNGHLDFGLMKVGISGAFTGDKSSKDENHLSINHSCGPEKDSHERQILLQSKVDWRDSNIFPEESGWFRVFVAANVNTSSQMDDRHLSGYICIYPLGAEPAKRDARMAMAVHRDSHKLDLLHKQRETINLHLGEREEKQYRNLSAEMDGLFNSLRDMVSGKSPIEEFDHSNFFCAFKFRIEADGIAWLKVSESTIKTGLEYVVARQAYYFLKYSLHIHKHHQSKQDALTTIVSLSGDEKSQTEAGLRLVCQLKRELTSLSRTKSLRTHKYKDQLIMNDAAGIIAYGRALIKSLRNRKIFDEDLSDRELERFDDLESSAKALNGKMENIHTITELVSSKSKVVIGFGIGLFYFAFGKSFTLDDKFLVGTINNFSDLFVGVALIGCGFSAIYFFLKKLYRSKHGLEEADTAQNIYKSRWSVLVLRITLIMAVWILIMYANGRGGEDFFRHLSGSVQHVGDYFKDSAN